MRRAARPAGAECRASCFSERPDRAAASLRSTPRQAKATLLSRLERFLHAHSHGDDLGLRLQGRAARGRGALRADGAGGRLRPGGGESAVSGHVEDGATRSTSRSSIRWARRISMRRSCCGGCSWFASGGVSAMLTMRNWMFIKQYAELRSGCWRQFDLRALGDFAIGCIRGGAERRRQCRGQRRFARHRRQRASVALQPTPPDDRSLRPRADPAQARSNALPRRPPRVRPGGAEGRAGVAVGLLVGPTTSRRVSTQPRSLGDS